jgi:hypothetical protein
MGVPVRLEVVDLGEDELVLRFTARHLEVSGHEVETVCLPASPGRVLGPLTGVGGLGVPPHRVVVEVADHVHRPAGFGDGEDEFGVPRLRGTLLAGHRILDRDRYLGGAVGGRDVHLAGQPVALDGDQSGAAAGVAHTDDLQRRAGRPGEQLRRLRGGDVHHRTLRRHPREMSTTSAR